MKKILLLSACLLALAAQPAAAQTPGPDLVVVRIFDNGAAVKLVITRGEGKNELVEFQGGATDKRLTATSEGYYKVLSALYREGYVLQSTFSNNGATMLILDKKR